MSMPTEVNEPTLVFFCPLDIAMQICEYAKLQGYEYYMTARPLPESRTLRNWHAVKVYTADPCNDTALLLTFYDWYEFTAPIYHYALYDVGNRALWKKYTGAQSWARYWKRKSPWG